VKSAGGDERVPALRNSKLVHTYIPKKGRARGEVVHSDYFKRYGAKREEILRYVLRWGRADGAELHKRFGSKTSRPGRFFRTWVQPMINDGVLAGDRGGVEMAPDWARALESVRDRTDEEGDNRRQSEKYAERRRRYLERLGAEKRGEIAPPERTPDLAGPEKVREFVEAAEKRDHAARIEEQRQKVGVTPEVFLADVLQDASGFGWRELRALWMAKGGKPEDLRRAVKHPYRFNREGGKGALYVEWTGTAPEPEREPAPVAILHEPEDWRSHPLDCECQECLSPIPTRHARAWSGA
jgi:hypothetical protein